MGICTKSIERGLHFVGLWSFDIGVLFRNFTSCVNGTHCQTNRYESKKITPRFSFFYAFLSQMYDTLTVIFYTVRYYSYFVYGTLSS